jgi:hypothetical protein
MIFSLPFLGAENFYLPVPRLIPLFLFANWPLPNVFLFDLAIIPPYAYFTIKSR